MNRRTLFHFEFPNDGAGAALGEPQAAPPAAEPQAPAGWQPTEQWGRQIDSFIQQAGPTLDALQQILYADPEPDPAQVVGDGGQVDPQAIQQLIQQGVQEQLGAFMPLFGQIAEERGEQMARSSLDALSKEIGPFNQDVAIMTALGFMQRGMDGEQALRAAAQQTFQFAQTERQAAVEEFKKSLGAAGTAQGDGGMSGSALESPGVPRGRSAYETAVSNFLGRRAPSLDGS
jgi:hypothetical protein